MLREVEKKPVKDLFRGVNRRSKRKCHFIVCHYESNDRGAILRHCVIRSSSRAQTEAHAYILINGSVRATDTKEARDVVASCACMCTYVGAPRRHPPIMSHG